MQEDTLLKLSICCILIGLPLLAVIAPLATPTLATGFVDFSGIVVKTSKNSLVVQHVCEDKITIDTPINVSKGDGVDIVAERFQNTLYARQVRRVKE